MSIKELERSFQKLINRFTVDTTDNGELVDVAYSFNDAKPSVIYDFKINKYSQKCFDFTPLQLKAVRLLIDDYLRSNGLSEYAGGFEVWRSKKRDAHITWD